MQWRRRTRCHTKPTTATVREESSGHGRTLTLKRWFCLKYCCSVELKVCCQADCWQEEKVPSSRPTSDLTRGAETSRRLCSTPLVLLLLFLCSSPRSNCSFSPPVSSLHLLRPKWPGLFGDPHGSSDHHPRAVRHRASVGSTGAAQDRRDRQRGEKHEC